MSTNYMVRVTVRSSSCMSTMCNIAGKRNAHVFPDPVLATATRSLDVRIYGLGFGLGLGGDGLKLGEVEYPTPTFRVRSQRPITSLTHRAGPSYVPSLTLPRLSADA